MKTDFRFTWELFLNGFDATEEEGKWNKNEYGEMESYCENILVSVLMHFIAVDGVITETEVDILNKMFGFNFALDYVIEICETMSVELESYVDSANDLISVIEEANGKIAEEFRGILTEACEIIVESEEVTVCEEEELRELLNNLKEEY